MMKINIETLKEQDAEELYQFEYTKRAFFEKLVPGRGDDYYIFDIFQDRHNELLKEQQKGMSSFYLIRDKSGSIVGRINLVDIDQAKHLAHIGYRIGEAHTGKGIAAQALSLLLKEIEDYQVKDIHAKTTSNNIASQKVLEKNLFKRMSLSDEEVELNGQRVQLIHYIWSK